jgi:DNA-binding response OmpR family regulator
MKSRYNILIAENESLMINLFLNQNHMDHNLYFVKDIIETITVTKKFSMDASIIDTDLPNAEGFEILRYLEIITKENIEIILLSRVTENYFLQKNYQNIYNKPLNFSEFKTMLLKIINALDIKSNLT